MKPVALLFGLLWTGSALAHNFSTECEEMCEEHGHGELAGWTQNGEYRATCECFDRTLLQVSIPERYERGVELYFIDPWGVRVFYRNCCHRRSHYHYFYEGGHYRRH